MSEADKIWYIRTADGGVYGPASKPMLVAWARDGRIEPSCFFSSDRIEWTPAQLMPELEMSWLVEIEPGKVFGPFNRAVVSRLFKSGELTDAVNVYRLHDLPIDEDPPPVEVIKEVVKEVRVEVPVEKIVEKIVEVPVEVPVEKIVEKIVEVPVEKIVEKVVEVEKPARTTMVVPEVVEPVDCAPPVKAPGTLFDGLDRGRLAALEAAAQRELARGRSFGLRSKFFGRRGNG